MATSGITSSKNNGSQTVSTDVYNRVQKTMAAQNGAATKLNTALKNDQTKLSALGQLQSALANFHAVAAGVTGSGLNTSVNSSAKNVLTATSASTSAGSAKPGTYAVNVKQLAQGQFLTSEAFAGASSAIGSGQSTTVKIDFGSVGGKQGFVANGGSGGSGGSKAITIDSSNNTLDGIAAAFKAAGVDVKVVKGDDGKFSLALAAKSGAANTLRISVSGDAALKNLLSFDPDGSQKLKQTSAGMDAIVTVDGKDVSSATNTLDKAIAGTTLTLTGTGKTEVSLTQDVSQIGANVKSLVSAYNEMNKKLQALQKGDLKTDTAMGQVSSQLNLLLKTGAGAALSAAGISQDSNGQLVLDEKKLQAALSSDAEAVGKLLTNNGKGLADMLAAKTSALTSDSSVISKETQMVSRDITHLNSRRTVLSKALTNQATALAALYTAQAKTSAGSAVNGTSGSAGSLFDILG